MLTSGISNTFGVAVLVSPAILWTHVVLFLVVADVITTYLVEYVIFGRCYCHYVILFNLVLADVIAIFLVIFVDGVVVTIWLMFSLIWQMLLPLFLAVGIAIMIVLPRFVPILYMACWQM